MRKKRTPIAPLPKSATWRQRVVHAFGRMSAGERKVATFLLENTTEAAFMRGNELAAHLHLDPASIVRFAQGLGYPGYPELLAEVAGDAKEMLVTAREILEPASGSAAAAWHGALLGSARAIRDLAGAGKDVRKFAAQLRGAKQVLVVAKGDDRVLAAWLAHNLRLAGLRAWDCDADPRASADAVATLRKGDVVLGVCLTGKGEAVAGVLKAGAGRGAPALAVACASTSLAPWAAEATLMCRGEDGLCTVGFVAIAEALRRALSAKAAAREG
jgi:DNA-binding MurR/RpiR family transcriptional regulator